MPLKVADMTRINDTSRAAQRESTAKRRYNAEPLPRAMQNRKLAGMPNGVDLVPRPATVLGVPIDPVLISPAAAGDPAIAKPEAAA